jgi:integrase
MLTIFRRRLNKCKFSDQGRSHRHCNCPIAVEGRLRGEAIRKSLDVRSWDAAQKIVREWEGFGLKNVVFLEDAYDRFISHHVANGSADDTIAKHKRLKARTLEFLGNFTLRSLSVKEVSRFREFWDFAPLTTRNTIERFRAFFNFCVAREWIEKNPARPLKLPKIEEVEVKPYTPKEHEAIMEAIENYPNWGYIKRILARGSAHSFLRCGGPG